MQYTGVIIKFKDYAVRSNRNYYTIDLLVTKYATHSVSTEVLSAADKAVEGATKENTSAVRAAEKAVDTATKEFVKAQEALLQAAKNDGDPTEARAAYKLANDNLYAAREKLKDAMDAAQKDQKGQSFKSN